jgi:menaquinone-dependent protoporphyrinogen IX oxidase
MNSIAVVYKSQYGTTKQYAKWIAEALGAQLIETSEVKPPQLAAYDAVIYGGGLYAGGIDGIGAVTKHPCHLLAVFTVGLADPATTDYTEILMKNLTAEQLANTKLFHLRGGVDYKHLGLVHKGMMAMMKKMVIKNPEANLSGEDKLFLETYGGQIDFTDQSTIEPLVRFVRESVPN